MSSNTGHGFVSFSETDPARVDVLQARYDQEEIIRRTRRGGQNVRDSRSEANKERKKYDPVPVGEIGMGARAYKPEVHFPVLEGDVDTLRQGIRRRPLPPGLHERPLQPGLQPEEEEEGTSFFTYRDSEQSEIPDDARAVDSEQSEIPVDTRIGHSSKKRNHLSLEGLNSQRNHLRKIVSFHFIPIQLMHVRKDLHFMWKILYLQLCVFLNLVAQEPWDPEKQLIHVADMLTHIPTVDSGMRFILQAQDFSLRSLNNQNVLRRLLSSCTIMDGIPNSQSSTLSKKVMSPC